MEINGELLGVPTLGFIFACKKFDFEVRLRLSCDFRCCQPQKIPWNYHIRHHTKLRHFSTWLTKLLAIMETSNHLWASWKSASRFIRHCTFVTNQTTDFFKENCTVQPTGLFIVCNGAKVLSLEQAVLFNTVTAIFEVQKEVKPRELQNSTWIFEFVLRS